MKPLLVSTSDRGGAGKACLRLHKGLISSGVPCQMLIRDLSEYNQGVVTLKKNFGRLHCIKRNFKKIGKQLNLPKLLYNNTKENFIHNRPKGLEWFSYPQSIYRIDEGDAYKQADIINLHWVADFLDFESFFLRNRKPVVWTLHDMNPFTGGEHYHERYLGMNQEGEPINRSLNKIEIQEHQRVISFKKSILSKVKNLHFIALNEWMRDRIYEDDFFKQFPVHIIPNGINSNVFKTVNRKFCRDLLNLPQEKQIVLFVADNLNNERKGFRFLLRACQELDTDNLILLSVGSSSVNTQLIPHIKHLGSINNEFLMNAVYNAADVFVIPSLIDNLPNTIIESLMCGTPVIGFPTGGIPEMITSGKNGLLTDAINSRALSITIKKFLDYGVALNREAISEQAVNKYDLKNQVEKYNQLFKNIVVS